MTLSVIIPTYNRCELLRQALNSVLAQEVAVDEIIVVDDGSTDETLTMLQNNYPAVIVMSLLHSGLASIARNAGVAIAQGDYIAFLDSDDLWFPNKWVVQQAQLQQNPTIKFLHSREEWRRNGKIISQQGQTYPHQGDIFQDSLTKCIIGPSTVVMEHNFFNALGGFNESLEVAEDYELWLRALNLYPCHYYDKALITKRQGDWPNLSTKYDHIEHFRIKALQGLLTKPEFTDKNKLLLQQELGRKLALYIAGCFKRGHIADAKLYNQQLHSLIRTL